MSSVRNGISRLDAGFGFRLVFLSALVASFLMCSFAFALGLVEYYGEKVMYVPLTEIDMLHHWSFELQNNGDAPVDVAILVASSLVYVENQLVTVQPFSSQKITFTVFLPTDVHYAVGDFADVSFEVAYAEKSVNQNIVLKKGLSGYMGIMVGKTGQQPVRDIHGMLAATGKSMESFRLSDDARPDDFYKPVAVTGLLVPQPEEKPAGNGGNVLVYIVAGATIIMCVAVFLFLRGRHSGGLPIGGVVGPMLVAALLAGVPGVLADSESGYDVSAEILNEAPVLQLLVNAGNGISGMLVGLTSPVTGLILALGIVGAILLLVYGFFEGFRNVFGGRFVRARR